MIPIPIETPPTITLREIESLGYKARDPENGSAEQKRQIQEMQNTGMTLDEFEPSYFPCLMYIDAFGTGMVARDENGNFKIDAERLLGSTLAKLIK